MPQHNHNVQVSSRIASGGNSSLAGVNSNVLQQYRLATQVMSSSTVYNITLSMSGNNKAHNNMPPYLAVYIWKRTA